MLSTNQKGAIAETAIVYQALRLGIDVYKPIAEGGRYDLVFGIGSSLLRIQASGRLVQVKSSSSAASRADAVAAG